MQSRASWGWFLAVLLSGCRGSEASLGFGAVEAQAESSEAAASEPPSSEAEASPPGSGGEAAILEPTEASSGAGAASGSTDCYAQPVTLDEVHSGRVRAGISVSVGELRATSQKFLLSEAKSGSCLWGGFAADPERSGAGSGLLLVSFGAPHAAGEPCSAGSDGLPDDLAAGDRLEVQGFLDEYVPAACADTAPAPQLRVDAACPARRVGTASIPEPAPIDVTLADQLAAGRDRELLRAWSGALVRLESLSARQDPDDLDAVFPFGVVRLEQTALEAHSRLYYFDLSQGGPRAPSKALVLPYPTRFESISGVVFLDYCTWALGPRDRCGDLAPPSVGCTDQAQRP